MSAFEQAVERIIKKNEKMILTSGTVAEVNGTSIKVEREEMADLLEVRFNSVLNSVENEFKITPKVGSTVLCGIIENDIREAVLIEVSEIEKVQWTVNEMKLEADSNGFLIENQGENLKTVINDMIDELNKIVVIQGTTINVTAMEAIKQRFNKILVK